MPDTKDLDVAEQVNVLFKSAMGFPSTQESRAWFLETKVKYNNYVNGEEILLDIIPSHPLIWTPNKTPYEVNLTDNDFDIGGYVRDDATGTIREYHRLILKAVKGSNDNAYYLLDGNGNNVLADGLQFNTKWPGGTAPKPYEYSLTTKKLITAANGGTADILYQSDSGGNWLYDIKNGIIFFPDYEPLRLPNLPNNDDNKPVFSFFKYIGRKGVAKQLSVVQDKLTIFNPENNQIAVQTGDDTIHRYDDGTKKWVEIGGSGGSGEGGASVTVGDQDPTGGSKGDLFFDIDDDTLKINKDGSDWVNISKGEKGDPGEQGIQGQRGDNLKIDTVYSYPTDGNNGDEWQTFYKNNPKKIILYKDEKTKDHKLFFYHSDNNNLVDLGVVSQIGGGGGSGAPISELNYVVRYRNHETSVNINALNLETYFKKYREHLRTKRTWFEKHNFNIKNDPSKSAYISIIFGKIKKLLNKNYYFQLDDDYLITDLKTDINDTFVFKIINNSMQYKFIKELDITSDVNKKYLFLQSLLLVFNLKNDNNFKFNFIEEFDDVSEKNIDDLTHIAETDPEIRKLYYSNLFADIYN